MFPTSLLMWLILGWCPLKIRYSNISVHISSSNTLSRWLLEIIKSALDEGDSIAQWLAYLIPDPAAQGSIPIIIKIC